MTDQPAQDALRHLQAAAIELIEAARAALVAVEEVVRDPSVLAGLAAAAQAAAAAAAGAGSGSGPVPSRPADKDQEPGAVTHGDGADGPDQVSARTPRGVTRIQVS